MEKIKRDRFEKRSINIAYPEIVDNEYVVKVPDIVLFKRVLEILQNNKFELYSPEHTADILSPAQKKRFRYNYDLERDLTEIFSEDDDLFNDDITDPLNRPTSKHRIHKSAEIRPKKRRRVAQ